MLVIDLIDVVYLIVGFAIGVIVMVVIESDE